MEKSNIKGNVVYEILPINRIKDIGRFAIFGSGSFAWQIYCYLKKTFGIEAIVVDDNYSPDNPPFRVHPLDFIKTEKINQLILGSYSFKIEMLGRLAQKFPDTKLTVYDINDSLWNDENAEFLYQNSQRGVAGKNILFIDPYPVTRKKSHLTNLFKAYEKKGIEIIFLHPLMDPSEVISGNNCIGSLIWNGSTPLHKPIIQKMQRAGIQTYYVEVGMFPQSDWFYIDPDGINAKRGLAHDDLSWVTSEDLVFLEELKENYFKEYPTKSPEYGLIPLQMPQDANIIEHSRFTGGMQEFIDFIENLYPKEKMIFKPHPLDEQKSGYRSKKAIFSDRPFLELLQHARWVHGINSTTLFESALYGVEVRIEGESLLKIHAPHLQKLLAAICARQIPVNAQTFENWSKRLTDLRSILP